MIQPRRAARLAIAGAVLGAAFVLGGLSTQALAGLGPFEDVPDTHPFAEDIAFMADTGIAGGFPDGTYRPGEPVTRQAMAAFIHRANTYTLVQREQIFAAVNGATLQAPCPEGRTVIAGGGGVDNSSFVYVRTSRPMPDGAGWEVQMNTYNQTTQNIPLAVYAICGPIELAPEPS